MDIERFDSVRTGLEQGVTLIEASAGTGKTYAIAMLALRFIVEKGMKIDELLIVTFTNAATEELRERVRLRLAEARKAVDGRTEGIDPNILEWIDHLTIEKADAIKRLEAALIDIDQACIFTIHGFCQRVLREHALESGQLFDSELSSDISAIRQACADDFWRQQVYGRPVQEAAILKACFDTPDALLGSVKDVTPKTTIVPAPRDMSVILDEFCGLTANAKLHLDRLASIVRQAIAEEKFKPVYRDNFDDHLAQLSIWMNGNSPIPPSMDALSLLTLEGLKNGLNGTKFKKTKAQSGDERKEEYLASMNLDTAPFDLLPEKLSEVTVFFRRALVEHLNRTLEENMQRLNIMSFNDLISRLSEVLAQDRGKLLTVELRKRFRAALIDEFQDTDHQQWHIFSTLFAAKPQYLFLIGDPKQAIYKFRGADIFSYFAAQKKAQQHYTLEKNWRSHPSLVEAVNALFQDCANPFLFKQLNYIQVKPALTDKNGALKQQGNTLPPMVLWQLEQSDNKQGTWTSGKASLELQKAVVNEILNLLDVKNSFSLEGKNRVPLQPKEIAILVRTNGQAREYQNLLREAEVPSVLNSTESVLASEQAKQLFILLHAIAHPGDAGLLKQALTLSWFNLDGQALYQLGNDEQLMDDWLTRFQDYYRQWQEKGLMTMMLNLLAQERVLVNISQLKTAERQLTNLHHLLELLQQATVDEHLGVNKILDWLHSAITAPGNNDEQQLRLESDEQAVKIVTMHRAKGLEYPVVFCPCLWYRSDRLKSEKQLVKCHENNGILNDLGSEDFEQHREQARNEELAEDLRLFYVAVTRAKYRCYIAWADVRTQKKPNESAMSWLLFGHDDIDYTQQQSILNAFSENHPEMFEYRSLIPDYEFNPQYRFSELKLKLAARQRTRQLETYWQMSSYTALSSLSLKDVPELPQDKVQEYQLPDMPDSSEEQLPKGPHTGNVVHDLLEKTNFRALARGEDISVTRDQACLRYGLKLDQPEILDNLLKKAVQTPLSEQDSTFCLANVAERQCLKEMPFFLSLDTIHVSRINSILQGSPAFQPLSNKLMQGYLTGFIDLVCEYQGRYYVMDYKTNSLADYRTETLVHAMREHNYGLQYWIYTLVLHLYLQNRLPEYNYKNHFGGVRYLFVRGMEPEQAMSGVFQDTPDFLHLEALVKLFGGSND